MAIGRAKVPLNKKEELIKWVRPPDQTQSKGMLIDQQLSAVNGIEKYKCYALNSLLALVYLKSLEGLL